MEGEDVPDSAQEEGDVDVGDEREDVSEGAADVLY